MLRGIFLVSLIFLSCQTKKNTDCNYITDYYQNVYKADLAFESDDFEKAFEMYQDAFNSCEAKNTKTYNEIGKYTEASAILKKYDITYEYAKKQILRGVELSRFENNDIFSEFLSSEYGAKLFSDYNSIRSEFIKNADLKLRDELILMKKVDQMYRGSGGKSNRKKRDSIDKIHEKRLIEMFETVGYPNDKIVGPSTWDHPIDVSLLLLHTDDSIRMNYFVPKVQEFIKNGTASPQTLGNMIDQYYLYNNEPQIYGTYKSQNGGYANMIDDLKKVDSNRISIGLPPLKLKEKKDSINKVKFGF